MTYLDNLAADWANTPGVLDVTHTDAAGTETAGKAHQDLEGPSNSELGGQYGISPTDTVWIVWAATMTGVTPVPTETLTDPDGTVWTILSVRGKREAEPGRSLVIKWRCVCREQV